jgi:hypothetical protein
LPKKNRVETTEEPQKPDGTAAENASPAGGLAGRRDLLIALGLAAIALILRLILLNAGLWYTDAVIAAQAAESTYQTLRIHYMHAVGYPGNVITIALLYAPFKLIAGASNAESATLFSSYFSASLSIGLLYLLVKRISGSTFAALSASLVLNALPVYLSTSTFGMSHQLAVFFLLLSFYLAALASESKDRRLLALASMSLGWAAAIRLESLQMLPLMALFYWRKELPLSVSTKGGYLEMKWRQTKDALLGDLIYLIAPMTLLLLIPYVPMLRENGMNTIIGAYEYNKWLGFWVPGLTEMVIGWVTISMTKLGWILAALGLVALFLRKDKHLFAIMLLWCFYFLVLANTATVEDRHTIPALAGLTVSIGFGLELLYARVHKLVAVGVLLILLYMMLSTAYPILKYRTTFCGPKAFAYTLRDSIEKNSVVIAIDETPHLQYYGGIDTIGYPIDGDMAKINKSMRELSGYLQNGTNLYMVSSALVYDTPGGLAYDPQTGLYNPSEKKVYTNLAFDTSTKTITDKSTGVTFGLYGIWQAELFSKFMVIPVKAVPNEDWHKKSVMPGNYTEVIFRISNRN